MAKKSPFTLPADLSIDLQSADLSISYDGDVVLEQTLGRRLGSIRCGGDLILDLDEVGGTLEAGGKVVTSAAVNATLIKGAEVHLGGPTIKAKAIAATRKIVIGAARLAVDVILAPEISIAPDASGRVTVIESHNEVGPSKIKGGFNLAEYGELFGDADEFLSQRGLAPLGEAIELEIDDEDDAGEEDEQSEGEGAEEEEDDEDPETVSSEAISAAPPDEPEDEPEEEPPLLSADDLEPVFEDEAYQPKLEDAFNRIIACYEGDDLPPAVVRLQELVTSGDHPSLRDSITEIWNGLLGFHQQRGIRPHHQVTHAFNDIHKLVQEG